MLEALLMQIRLISYKITFVTCITGMVLCMFSIVNKMRYRLLSFILILCLTKKCFCQAKDYVQYVNPLTGTGASAVPATLKNGEGTELYANTIPAVTLPFAMTQFTPQTRLTESKCSVPYFLRIAL